MHKKYIRPLPLRFLGSTLDPVYINYTLASWGDANRLLGERKEGIRIFLHTPTPLFRGEMVAPSFIWGELIYIPNFPSI